MKVQVAAHYLAPASCGNRFLSNEMEVDHTTKVKDFLKMYAETIGKKNKIDLNNVNLIYGDKVRAANEPISETEFESNAPQNRTFIHLQIDNVPWTEEDEHFDLESLLIPLDDVTMKEPPAKKERPDRKARNKKDAEEKDKDKAEEKDNDKAEEKDKDKALETDLSSDPNTDPEDEPVNGLVKAEELPE